MVLPGMRKGKVHMKKGRETKLEKEIRMETAELERAFNAWETIRDYGCNDPFWPDGTNMNLERNHIIYGKRKLKELCGDGELPEIYYRATPPEVDDDYMCRDGKHFETRREKIVRVHQRNVSTRKPKDISPQDELF